jgi:shikimate dehydrogenase
MKKYLVIGNPIGHSLSPVIHNYWIKKNNLNATYDKKELKSFELKKIINSIREKEISGINVTVPFKKEVIPYLDELSVQADNTQSVNTIFLNKDKIIGHNTDIDGFELAIKNTTFDLFGKKILILGAGGVVPSIIFALNKMNVSEIMISNRTKSKAENLKNLFGNIKIVEWGILPNFDMIINATSLGLKNSETISLDFSKIKKGKLFYDVIYNPEETNFLKEGKKSGGKIENGKKMFIYQAAASFNIWHGIYPEIDNEINYLLKK